MFYDTKFILNVDKQLLKKDNEIARTKKILADHNERIRILELAIQNVLSRGECSCWGDDSNCCVAYDDSRDALKTAVAESHKIALREYPI